MSTFIEDPHTRARSAAPELLAVLKDVEWAGTAETATGAEECCPWCSAPEAGGAHADGCQLAAALAKAGPRLHVG